MERCAGCVVLLNSPIVALVADRSYGLVVSLLGVLRSGKAYCPIEPEFPASRAGIMLETAGIQDVLVPVSQLPNDLVSHFDYINVLAVHDDGRVDDAKGSPLPTGALPPKVPDDSTAYVLFTSGSTGKPKGCMVPHRGSANYAAAVVQSCMLDKEMVFVLKTPYVFDVSIQDMFAAFCAGGLLVIAEPGVHKDSGAMVEMISQNKVNCCCFVPTLLVEFSNYLANHPEDVQKIRHSLRRVLTIGEALMSDTCRAMFDLFPELQIHNLYGPTEASVGVSHYCATKETLDLSYAVVPIGKPFDYVKFCVFDPSKYEGKTEIVAADLAFVAQDQVGELFIGGDCLAQGYISNPEKTAAAFFDFPSVLSRPDCAASKFSLYKTGDLVKQRSGGVFEYLGRNDFQVKIGGVRIECEEVSAVLKTHPSVADALVTAFEGPYGKALAGYVVASDSADWSMTTQDDSAHDTDDQEGTVSKWGAVYDEMYKETDASVSNQDPTLNWSGYIDTYSRKPHIEPVIKEWVEWSCEQVSRHFGERDSSKQVITELGCGNGMLLFRLAPHSQQGKYVGTDISSTALDYVQRMSLNTEYSSLNIKTAQLAAHEIMKVSEEKENDMVLCNGVTMYFPSAEYLLNCMKIAAHATRSDGFVIFGDIQSKRHLLPFRCHVETFQARRRANVTAATVLRLAKQAAAQEELSYFDDQLFPRLDRSGADFFEGRLARVELRVKRGWWHSEFNRFRYDVELVLCDRRVTEQKGLDLTFLSFEDISKELQLTSCPNIAQASYPDDVELVDPKLRELLPDWVAQRLLDLPASKDGIVLKLPNARTLQSVRLMEWLEEGAKSDKTLANLPHALNPVDASKGSIESSGSVGIEPEMLFNLPLPDGWTKRVIWDEDPALLRFVVLREEAAKQPWLAAVCEAPDEPLPSDLAPFRNRPEDVMTEGGAFDPAKACNDALKAWASKTSLLPAMQPSVYIMMDAFPKNTAGKTDRNALPNANEALQQLSDASLIAFELPSTEEEKKMVRVWESVLKVSVGVTTPFVAYGGHSLTALQLCSKIFAEFGKRPDLAFLTSDDCSVRQLLAKMNLRCSTKPEERSHIVRLSPPEAQGVNLLIFCAAGADASVYAAVAQNIRCMQVYAVELPGRGQHNDEPLETNFGELVSKLEAELTSWVMRQTDYIFLWGDSLGAVLAYNFACKWQTGKVIMPLGLFVSGNAGPLEAAAECGIGANYSQSFGMKVTTASEMQLGDWVHFLIASSGRSQDEIQTILRDEAIAEDMVAALRADCLVYESYQLDEAEAIRLKMPIMTMRGELDCITAATAMRSWKQVAGGRLEHKEFPGAGHMVAHECPSQVAQFIFQASLPDFSSELRAYDKFRAAYRVLRSGKLSNLSKKKDAVPSPRLAAQTLPVSPTLGAQPVPEDLGAQVLDFSMLDLIMAPAMTPPTKQVKIMRAGNMQWRKGGHKGNVVKLP